MASILDSSQPFIILNELFDTESSDTNTKKDKVSIWIKDKSIIKASTDITMMKTIEPGVYTVDFNRDIGYFCQKMDIKSDELFVFSDSITQKLIDEIQLFWDKADLYKHKSLIHKRGILLEGFPGTGKSSIISLLSAEIISRGGVVFKVINWKNLGDYIEFVTHSFRKIQPDTPIITIIEDLDQYEDAEVELLDFLDGKSNIEHHVVIATTNNTESIPDTFLRPSRLDLKIEVPLPCDKTREEYFKFKELPSEDIPDLVKKSEGFSLADLKELYICVYLLDYTPEDAVQKIKAPREKRNYLTSHVSQSKLGF